MQALGFIYAGGFVVAMIALYVRVGFPAVDQDWRDSCCRISRGLA